jgi:hypothetical protein
LGYAVIIFIKISFLILFKATAQMEMHYPQQEPRLVGGQLRGGE